MTPTTRWKPTIQQTVVAAALAGLVAVFGISNLRNSDGARDAAAGAEQVANDTRELLEALRQSARRTECVRDKQADAERIFRVQIGELLSTGELARRREIAQQIAHEPDLAEAFDRECPAAIVNEEETRR